MSNPAGTAPTAPAAPVAPKTPAANVSGVSSYISDELGKDRTKAKKEEETRPKFIIYLDPVTKKQLESLKVVAGVGKIELATKIFACALGDACKAAIAKGRMTADFEPVGAETAADEKK